MKRAALWLPEEKGCRKMLFQKEKEICSWHSPCRKQKNKDRLKKTEIDRKKQKSYPERKRSLWNLVRPFPPTNGRHSTLSEKVSLCTPKAMYRRASLAVETALVLPLFFLGLVTMVSFMDIYRIQTEHLSSLCEKTKEAGMYAYALDEKGPEEITFPDIYSYTPVGGLIPLPEIWMHNTVKVHTWTGSDWEAADGNSEEDENEEMVFVTETGSVYHKSAGCHYLKLSLNQIPGSQAGKARNDYGEKYHPCEICSRNQKPAGSVYVTGTGNRYHNLDTCSGLKRTVKLVKKSEVKNMHACSKCG